MPGHSTRQATVTKSVCPFLLSVLQWGVLNSLNKAEGCQCWCAPETLSMELKGYLFEQGKDNFILISSIFVIELFSSLLLVCHGTFDSWTLQTWWQFDHFLHVIFFTTVKTHQETGTRMCYVMTWTIWFVIKKKKEERSKQLLHSSGSWKVDNYSVILLLKTSGGLTLFNLHEIDVINLLAGYL